MRCPLCQNDQCEIFAVVDQKSYRRCQNCELRFLDLEFYLSADEELAHYCHHENKVEDEGYRRFLSRLSQPLLAKLNPGSKGLDYGCGPGPALADMLVKAGHRVNLYDPFFCSQEHVLAEHYDFICCTETAEHFHDPAFEFDRFNQLLRPGGWLGVMTMFQTDDARFDQWHYRRDPTHVVFYRPESFSWIARKYGWATEIPAKDIVLFHKAR